MKLHHGVIISASTLLPTIIQAFFVPFSTTTTFPKPSSLHMSSTRFKRPPPREDGWYPSQFLNLPDGHRIAYDELYISKSDDQVVYLPNLADGRSNPTSWNVEKFCEKNSKNFLVADWFGRGDSTGKLMEATLTRWTDDTIALLDNVTPQRVRQAVLVGSGVGGWVAVLVALKRPDLVRGLVGLGADPDFTEDLLWKELPPETKETIMQDGFQEIEWGLKKEVYPITRSLIEDGRTNLVLRGGPKSLPIKCPVRLIHSLSDVEVPPITSLRLAECIESDNVVVTMPKFGVGTPYAAIKQCFEMTQTVDLRYTS